MGKLGLANILVWFALLSFLFSPLNTSVAHASPDIKIKHKPVKYFVPGHRIRIEVNVEDDVGVNLVRCYFRAQTEADYVFVGMSESKKNSYLGLLPAPSIGAESVWYLFLAVNGNNQVVKTQTYIIPKREDKKPPAWQQVSSEGEIIVSTELRAATSPPGFADSITMDVVESSLRYGFVVGGIYTESAIATVGGISGTAAASTTSAGAISASTATAASATSAGAISASTGLSTASIVGIGAGIAAVGGVFAAASGGGSEGGDNAEWNAVARISWGDDDTPSGDAFQVTGCNRYLGENPTGGDTGITMESGFPVGTCDLTITCISAAGDTGNYIIDLAAGAIFTDDNSTHKEGTLREGESRTYQIYIPPLADTVFSW